MNNDCVSLVADEVEQGPQWEPLIWRKSSGTRGGGITNGIDSGYPVADSEIFEGIIGRSQSLKDLCEQIRVVAPTETTSLILGETGTGKELIARAIHNLSSRNGKSFIKVNCAAIPAGLIESELFGHERGSFTGALTRRIGRFELADRGTLFLDEVGDIPLELQPKLLRVLQEQEFERIGSTQTTRVNVRIVAATSRDLPGMVSRQQFRADLYYRLNVFPLCVPALKDRAEDVPLLVRHFLNLHSKRMNQALRGLSQADLLNLMAHSWPGNIRELQNVVERAVILPKDGVLTFSLEELDRLQPTTVPLDPVRNRPATKSLKDVEREHILRALALSNWVLGGPNGAGARLGLPRTTLIGKMHRLGISRPSEQAAMPLR